jgi:hypothetical protein
LGSTASFTSFICAGALTRGTRLMYEALTAPLADSHRQALDALLTLHAQCFQGWRVATQLIETVADQGQKIGIVGPSQILCFGAAFGELVPRDDRLDGSEGIAGMPWRQSRTVGTRHNS